MKMLRRFAVVLTLTALAGVVVAPPLEARTLGIRGVSSIAASVETPLSSRGDQRASQLPVKESLRGERGQGVLGCFTCGVGAGFLIAGGPGAILGFLASPSGSALIIACTAWCVF
jgi:hypothetical protein